MSGFEHQKQIALLKWLSATLAALGVADATYVVGGAVRNWLLGRPIKDVDIVVDSLAAGQDSDWVGARLAEKIPAATNLTTNQYGVAILTVSGSWEFDGVDLKGEVLEIANARSESYAKGEGYKPTDVQPATIEEDLKRREFCFNTLLWRFSDLTEGPEKAEVLDLTGRGVEDLHKRLITCPSEPDTTFFDDPTRMLRAVKFMCKYDFNIEPQVESSIRRNAHTLKRVPWEAAATILVENVLKGPNPRLGLSLLVDLELWPVLNEMLEESDPFRSYLTSQLRTFRRVDLLLALMEHGIKAVTPLSFLDSEGCSRMWELHFELGRESVAEFASALIKPPVDNRAVISELGLEGRDRGRIQPAARSVLLESPELAKGPKGLTERVIAALR